MALQLSLQRRAEDAGTRYVSRYIGETRAAKLEDARQLLAKGVDPSGRKQAEKVAIANTFESVAREWLVLQEKRLAAATYAKAVWTLETLIFPFIGNRPINEIKAADVLKVLQRIENRGLHETAHRARQRCGQVFRYGIVTERCEHDITADLRGAEAHIVPLTRQVVAWLKELHALTGKGSLVFPSLHSSQRPISENTVNMALRRMGYDNETMTGHGFRAMASTSLNEQGWHPDLIELQLAHAERNKVRSAYNHAQRLSERRAMMQWSDYLDELRAKADPARGK